MLKSGLADSYRTRGMVDARRSGRISGASGPHRDGGRRNDVKQREATRNDAERPLSTDAKGKAAEAGQLEQRLAQRIADAREAEARLDQKVSQLARAEQTLHGLLDSLRHAVSEACPLVGELRNYGEAAKSTVNEVVQTAKAQFAQVVALVRNRLDLLKEAEGRFAGTVQTWEASARQRLAGLGNELADQVEPAVEAARARIRDVADGLPMILAEKLETFRV